MDYKIKRSGRKTVSLEITKSLEILVRAPYHMPAADIRRFVQKHRDWIQKHLERQKVNFRPEPSAGDIHNLKTLAGEMIPARVEYYANIMGLSPASVKITAARTRFGSCSGKNGLCFSCFLMLYPSEAIDYVVVHELAHIVHKNHQSEFWALVGSVFPDYKERKAMLKAAPVGWSSQFA